MHARTSLNVLGCALAAQVALSALTSSAAESVIREGPPAPAVLWEHMPSRLHAYVWRNWELVDTPLLARTIDATPEQLERIAGSMGLGANRAPSRSLQRQIYITIVRRNWHLLPYEQLLALIGMSRDEFEFRLREDDFLASKLGGTKPACARLRYEEPDAETQARAATINGWLSKDFGAALQERGEMPLAFSAALNREPELPPAPADPDGLRFIFSYFGAFGDPLAEPTAVDPYPDGLLARLAATGVNGVWLHVVLRDLAPGGPDFPEFGAGHEKRLDSLRRLVAKARRHGIRVYLYMNEPRAMPAAFFTTRPDMAGVRSGGGLDLVAMCTSDARVRRWMGDALSHVFREVPGLGGVFTITASENLTNCASKFHQEECPRCKTRSAAEIIAEVNATIEAGVHRGNSNARVIVWDWGWARHGDASDYIRLLPKNVWFMSVSEWAQPFRRGSVDGQVGEYSISVVGPGPRATRHWAVAREQGLKTVAKVQINNTWELSSVPYLPAMDLIAQHCANLARAGVDGLMLSWSLGGYPSPNLRLAQSLIDRKYPDVASALDALARDRYGPDAAPYARRAWTSFSRGFQEFPYGLGLYTAPQQAGPANLLYRTATRLSATMCCYPYDDLKRWCGRYSAEEFMDQFAQTAKLWAEGFEPMRAAAARADGAQARAAREDLAIAEAAYCHFASVAEQARFIVARDALARNPHDGQARQSLLDALDHELGLAKRLYGLARADSRIGFEAANHYFYTPLDLAEAVIDCEYLKRSFAAPAR